MVEVVWDDIWPHLYTTLFITGSFVVAWSWDLVLYGASHAWYGDNPLNNQLGFGDIRAPKHLAVLLLQYLLVCGLVALLSDHLKRHYLSEKWSQGAITAAEFFPSPVFAGKLMAYLVQFSRLGTAKQMLINFGAILFAAGLAYAMKDTIRFQLPPQLERFPEIVRNSLGFGLGVAWNVLLSQLLAPKEMNASHLLGIFGYLLVVTLIAFRLAVHVDPTLADSSFFQRQMLLFSFAAHVVCAFTLVAFLNALLDNGWFASIGSFFILVVLSGVMSAIVATVDFDHIEEQVEQGKHKYGFGTCSYLDALAFVPCTWCCCPWVPLAWLLAGMDANVNVKERWYELIAFVSGLAASIQASGMLTNMTNFLGSGFCDASNCKYWYAWLFVGLQALLAILTTVILIPALAHVAEPIEGSSEEQICERPRSSLRTKLAKLVPKRFRRGENQSLLGSRNQNPPATNPSFVV
jgi:hypothetical protein